MVFTTNNAISAYYSNTQNLCIGGDFSMNPWQRGTSANYTPTSSLTLLTDNGNYLPDMFKIVSASGLGVGVNQVTYGKTLNPVQDPLNGVYSDDSFGMVVANAQSVLPNDAGGYFCYILEGYDAAKIYNRYFTLSFYVYASVAGTYSVTISPNSPTNTMQNYYIAPYTVNVANTWQKISITIPPDPFNNVTWNLTNGVGLSILFTYACANNRTTVTTNTWINSSNNLYAAQGQVNLYNTVGNTFQINLVQIEQGTTANPFQMEVISDTLRKCMRYYQKTFPQGVTPNSGTGTTGAIFGGINGGGASSPATLYFSSIIFPVPMRSTPSVVFYNPVTTGGIAGRQVRKLQPIGVDASNTQPTVITSTSPPASYTNLSEKTLSIQFTVGAPFGSPLMYTVHYTLDASL